MRWTRAAPILSPLTSHTFVQIIIMFALLVGLSLMMAEASMAVKLCIIKAARCMTPSARYRQFVLAHVSQKFDYDSGYRCLSYFAVSVRAARFHLRNQPCGTVHRLSGRENVFDVLPRARDMADVRLRLSLRSDITSPLPPRSAPQPLCSPSCPRRDSHSASHSTLHPADQENHPPSSSLSAD